jgi:hypothetical protein
LLIGSIFLITSCGVVEVSYKPISISFILFLTILLNRFTSSSVGIIIEGSFGRVWNCCILSAAAFSSTAFIFALSNVLELATSSSILLSIN